MDSEPHRDSQRPECPGLRADLAWDAQSYLRGEIYASEHLAEHARELARAHGETMLESMPGPLRLRFGVARAQIRAAYEILARDANRQHDPSPAEEWLLDNSHVVAEQIREIQEDLPWGYLIKLPRLKSGKMRRYPRVYGLCLDYLRHSDARVDLHSLGNYVRAYQRETTLTIGELWAVPIMLRLGLTLMVGALAVTEASAKDRARADAWAAEIIVAGQSDKLLSRSLAELDRSQQDISAGFLVQLLKRIREHEAPLAPVMEWLQARCQELGSTPEELVRLEHLRLAADQVSVGNAITSMRAIAALDWTRFFEATSEVEETLKRDPAGAYPAMERPSRDRCRHAVEKLSRRSGASELSIAERALALAQQASLPDASPTAESHVGYYLVDAGRAQLEREISYCPSLGERLRRAVQAFPAATYLGAMFVLVLAFCFLAAELLRHQLSAWELAAALLLLSIPASEIALAVVNALLVAALPPHLLPKLDFDDGIPDEHRTLVVVPSLLENEASLAQLLEDLEVRALANPGKNLYWALLTDFTDADSAETNRDQALLAAAMQGIAALNAKGDGEARYFLLHRRRLRNEVEGRFMGWERKRGKLEELNALLRGATTTSFAVVTAPRELLHSVRYVITLDADTDLPREVARRLVGAMAHPQNRPVLDSARRRVVRGYGIIQPRVGTLPLSSRRSRFARIFAGPPGIDPYTTAVSDVYQDLFREGSFVGKGIYDVDAFQAALDGRVPSNRLLSHDLFESSFARSALATDIEVLDEQPASYDVTASRQHRWLRGDWQLLSWLWPVVPARNGRQRNDLRILDRWKLFDNLRRSLVAPALVVLLALSWFAHPELAAWSWLLLFGVFAAPLLVRQVLEVARASTAAGSQWGRLGGEAVRSVQQGLLALLLILDQALLALDGIVRTLYRCFVSRRNMLEWTTMSQASRSYGERGPKISRRFAASGLLALFGAVAVVWLAPAASASALPLLLGWAFSPVLIGWLGRPLKTEAADDGVSEAGRRKLALIARKTWRFFETFVTAEDNWLPPDNFQEEPRGVVAHRTSPTNIGLYLLSVVAARDLGFITAREVVDRLENTLATLKRMERRSGHILNWYDTTTLRPLEPQYVSTVDSGNLAGYLWTLREACAELGHAPLVSPMTFQAAHDALELANSAHAAETDKAAAAQRVPADLARLQAELLNAAGGGERSALELRPLLLRLAVDARALTGSSFAAAVGSEAHYWLGQAQLVLEQAQAQLDALAPCLGWLANTPELFESGEGRDLYAKLLERMGRSHSPEALAAAAAESLLELSRLESAVQAEEPALNDLGRVAWRAEVVKKLGEQLFDTKAACEVFCGRARKLADEAVAFADAMDFGFLFDKDRELFAIGYDVSGARLDGSHYDLLASEARLASFVAISKGDIPVEHWWRLSRPRTTTPAGRVLLSWSGSMFEYLMPLLVMPAASDTLLWETCRTAVGRQRSYGAEQHVPWGVSEAAYNVMDLGMTYQYRAFGVPGLGLKNGLGQDLVVAPYATALATLVRPDLALANFEALERQGLDARYGYYEAIDYTKAHVPPGRRSVIVKAFMAHHEGMSLVALCNVLCDSPMQRRFFADARVKASALLLEERVPHSSPVIQVRSDQISAPTLGEPELGLTDHVGLGAQALPRLHLLGHGELSCLIFANGSSAMTWKGMDVTRFREDSLLEPSGIFVYVRDLSNRRLWSAGQQPVGQTPDYYDATFSIDRVELKRRDESIETVMEVVVSPELPAEMRRITLTNHGRQACELDVTSYCEAVLATRGADVAHRAFSSMFLETELIPERGAILVRRRPRSVHEAESWMVQVLSADGEGFGEPELDSSRASFLGRAGSLQKPRALHDGQKLAGTSGHVLDAGLSLRRSVRLEPGQRARATLTTGLATSREAALALLDLVVTPSSSARAFELAWADARVELRHLGTSAASSFRFQRLLSCLVNAPAALREAADSAIPLTQGRQALWSQGISGDLPILALRIDHPDFGELCKDVLLAHEFWRLNGIRCDLVVLNEEPEGYLQPLQEALTDLVRSSPALGQENQPGGVFLRRAGQLSAEERLLILRSARVVLRASAGSLSQQLRAAAVIRPVPAPLLVSRRREQPLHSALPASELQHFNGVGGFSPDGREYVMSIGPGSRTPLPWCNVLSNPHFGSLVSESGLGFTWCGNSQRERLTAWSNDSVLDPAGQTVYLRDDDDGRYWSATPAPASHDAHFSVRHGQGYSSFTHEQSELQHELTVQVSPQDPVQVLHLRLHNRGNRTRRLSIFGVVEWVLGASREATRFQVGTGWDAKHLAIVANNPFSSTPGAVAFFGSSEPVVSFTADREEFFGLNGSRSRPAALGRRVLAGRVGLALDPCAALQVSLELAPGESREVCFVLGQAASPTAATLLLLRHAKTDAARTTRKELTARWEQLQAITVESPDSTFDLMVNHWLLYQVAGARIWARSGFYQSSGAYGYRDQLQDVLALLHGAPELAREHLLRAAARQFVEGDVQHWWHPETGEGVRSHCSDDLLWLPYAVAKYLEVTGDYGALNEQIPFLEARPLKPDEDDVFGAPPASGASASLYEHCVRALVRGASMPGARGLPLMGGGDWNDGMNRVGAGGRGESVWLGWFLARTLQDFAPVAAQQGDPERAEICRTTARKLLAAIEAHAWDGAWYRRAFYDDGTPLGSRENAECRIDAIAQSWSVIASGDHPRTRRAVASSEGELIVPDQRMMLLLKPPFTDPAHEPGYIRSYPPGIRENGGQYTHGVLWTAQALCLLGEGDRAYRLLSFLNPISHANSPSSVRRYQVEPYVVAADVYSNPEHLGRGGWTWYTGSASWFYRIATENVLGLKRSREHLAIAPCLPTSWPSLSVTYRYGRSELRIAFENPQGAMSGVLRVELDGRVLPEASVPLVDDGQRHAVRVVMGEAPGDAHPSVAAVHGEGAAQRP